MLLHSRIEGEGKPLVIIHGFLGMSDNWKTLGTQFANEGFQVHALDLRNHGKSFHSEDFSYDIMVEDVKQYCDYHKLIDISIIGHFMGVKEKRNRAIRTKHEIIYEGQEEFQKILKGYEADEIAEIKLKVLNVGLYAPRVMSG